MNLVISIAAVFALLLAGLYLFQGRLVFFPMKRLSGDPSAVGLEFQDVSISTGDGEELHGWFVPSEKMRSCVLFFHGNAGNISHRLQTLRLINGLGLPILIFDYRGYGRSTGKPNEEGVYKDAEAAWRKLTGELGFDPSEVILWGRSLGGAIAAKLAAEVRPAALILESTFTSVPDMGRKLYPFLPIGLIACIRFPVIRFVQESHCPVLVVHSPEDEVVPFEMGRKLYEAAPAPKQFLEIRGSHNNGFLESGKKYIEGIERFLSEVPEAGNRK